MLKQKTEKLFQPEDFGFKKLELQNGSLCFYEYASGDFCNGKLNAHRINVYLSKDHNFVTVWHGLFDPACIDQKFHDLLEQSDFKDFDFSTQYNTPLLRAHIESSQAATIILKSLHYEQQIPSMLIIDAHNKITCVSVKQQTTSCI